MPQLQTKIYMRLIVGKHVFSKMILKEKCEICDSTTDLDVHHDEITFAEILEKAHNLSGITQKKYTDEYTHDEIKLLSYVVLGMHTRTRYKILCNDCHVKYHSNNLGLFKAVIYRKKYKQECEYLKSIGYTVQNYENFQAEYNTIRLEEIINKYKDRRLFKEAITEMRLNILDTLINDRGYFRADKTAGLQNITGLFTRYNLPFQIKGKRARNKSNRGTTYWIITSI